jgi:hypothetical protein
MTRVSQCPTSLRSEHQILLLFSSFIAIGFAPGGSSPTLVETKTIKQHYTVLQHTTIKSKHNTIKRKQHNTIKCKYVIIRTQYNKHTTIHTQNNKIHIQYNTI